MIEQKHQIVMPLLVGLTYPFIDSIAKHALQYALPLGENTSSRCRGRGRGRGRGRRGCLRRILEIHQNISKCHVDSPTTPFPDDLTVVLWIFFDILGIIHKGTWLTVISASGLRESNTASIERSRLAPRCKHAQGLPGSPVGFQ